jgi:DNA-directed RNA polymerase subunit RPC12/RpoP
LEAKSSQAGKNRRCPVCYFKLTVPTAEEVAATTARWREPGYQVINQQNEVIPSAAAYQTYFAVVCSVCGTRMYAAPSQVGQEMRCPDCDTPALVAPPPAKPTPPADAKPSTPSEEYPLYEGGGQPPPERQEVYRHYIPVVCPICHTRMLAPPEQVGQRLICPDCETPSLVPPPEEVTHEPLPMPPSGDPADVYDVVPNVGQPPPSARWANQQYVAAVCPVCHTRLNVTADKVGTAIECPDCGTRFAVAGPKTAPPQPNPMEEIEEGYGIAAPPEVAQRQPALYEADDLQLEPDERRSVQERQDLEEEWKSFNQKLRSGWQAAPTEAAQSPRPEPQEEPDKSFIRGVLAFPFYPSSMAYWVALSLGLMFVVLPPSFAIMLALRPNGPGWGWAIVASAMAFVAGLLWVLMTSSTCLAILQDTAEGCDEVENWPEGQFYEWLFDTSYIFTAAILTAALGLGTVRLLDLIGHPWWPAGLLVGWLAFPLVLVSMLEAGSPLLPFSWLILRSLFLAWWTWLAFYLESTLVITVAAGAGVLVTIPTRYWGSPVALALAVAVLMIYFRLLGRLVWFCSHEGVLEDDKPQRTDDKPLYKRAAEME